MLRLSSLYSTLNFDEIEGDLLRLYVLVCFSAANQYSEIIANFLEIQTEEHNLRVNKRRLTSESTLNKHHLEIEGNH